jgi:plastocyanin
LIHGNLGDATVQLRNSSWFVVSILELNVFVPEGVTLEIETDEVRTAFEQTGELAVVSQVHKSVGMGGGSRGELAVEKRDVL